MFDYTVTIVAYRNYSDIKEALRTLTEHTSAELRYLVYVIDNSCLDETSEEKQDFIRTTRKYDNVRYVDIKENLGFGKGHNYQIKQLDSKLHLIMNPDILLTEDSLSVLKDFMQDESIGMCVPRLVDEKGNLLQVYRRELTVWDLFIRMFAKDFFKKRFAYHTMQDMDYSKPMQVPFAQGSFLVIRTELFKKLGGFDDRFFMYMEDADLCKRVNQCSRLTYCPYTSVIHKWEKGSHKNAKLLKYHLSSMFRYFNKWGWKIS